jgi:RNA polymerase sigma factor (sigma-70 family)
MSTLSDDSRPAPASSWNTHGAIPIVTNKFEAIFLEHWPGIYRMLVRLVGDGDEAEDLALETFMRLYQQKKAMQALDERPENAEFNVSAWLYRVATNLGLNAIRGWKRRQRREMESGLRDFLEQFPESPAEVFAAEEDRSRVREVLAGMRPRQSQLLVLRHSGRSYREIAAIMGVSVTSIGPLLFRAEKEFGKRFRALFPEGG